MNSPAFASTRRALHDFHEHTVAPALQAMLDCDIPLLAQIDGACIGGGLEIAACCDIRVCGESSRFGAPIAKLGFPMAPGELERLSQVFSAPVLREMLLEARLYDAHEALRAGAVHAVVPDAEVAGDRAATRRAHRRAVTAGRAHQQTHAAPDRGRRAERHRAARALQLRRQRRAPRRHRPPSSPSGRRVSSAAEESIPQKESHSMGQNDNHNLFSALRAAFPKDLDATAIETGDGPRLYYTWRDLDRATARIANLLVSLGLPAGARVAVQTEKSVEALMLYLAVLRAGYVYLPLNTAYQGSEIEYFIGNAEPSVVVCSGKNFGWVSKIAFKAGTEHVFTLNEDRTGSLLDRAAPRSDEHTPAHKGADDLAAILYTSGTTALRAGRRKADRRVDGAVAGGSKGGLLRRSRAAGRWALSLAAGSRRGTAVGPLRSGGEA